MTAALSPLMIATLRICKIQAGGMDEQCQKLTLTRLANAGHTQTESLQRLLREAP